MMHEPIRLAILGLGGIGQRHAMNALTLLDPSQVCGYDQKLNGVRALYLPTGQPLELMADLTVLYAWQPTHVLVATPPATHRELTIEAAARGCHVFVEKPLALTLANAVAMVDDAARRDRQLVVGYQLRAHRRLRELKRLMIGELRQEAQFVCHWKDTRALTYDWPGVFVETSHELDLAIWLLGPVAAIETRHVTPHEGFCRLRHDSGAVSHLAVRSNSPVDARWCAIMLQSGIELKAAYRAGDEMDRAYVTELEWFLRNCPIVRGHEVLETMRIMEQLT